MVFNACAHVHDRKNLAMSYTELEAKTREATNNEPWGASSELMHELARATNFG